MTKELTIIPDNLPEAIKWAPTSTPHSREVCLRRNLSRSIESYLISGMILCLAEEKQDWRKAKCNSHSEWLENEQRISRGWAVKMQVVWRKMGKFLPKYYQTIIKIPFSNLYEVARISEMLDEIKLIELMDNAAVNTERDFKNNIREVEGKIPPTDKCDHVTKEIWYRCRKCKQFIKTDKLDADHG